ncbi:MAG: hypothetical protein ACRENF_00730, partial [Thermodesulfobacteriota bacterium]
MRLSTSKIALVLIILTAFSRIGFGEEQFMPDQSQSKFAQSLKGSVSGVVDASWKTHVDLWVQSSGVDQRAAKKIAGEVLEKGSRDLGQMFCVHVPKG